MKARPSPSHRTLPWIAAAIVANAAAGWPIGARAEPAVRTSAEQGVTLKVTPTAWVAGDREWSFSVVLDAHSQALDDDLAKSAVLVIDGREVKPLQWTGAAPGGHHREGRLGFPAPAALPQTVELRIQRPGEVSPRIFRWDAAALQ